MLKKISIKNYKGIEKMNLDFQQSRVRKTKGVEDQIIWDGSEAISLIPTIIAKNASFKTSLLKAILFIESLKDYRFLRGHSFGLNRKFFSNEFDYNNLSEAEREELEPQLVGKIEDYITEIWTRSLGNNFQKVYIQIVADSSTTTLEYDNNSQSMILTNKMGKEVTTINLSAKALSFFMSIIKGEEFVDRWGFNDGKRYIFTGSSQRITMNSNRVLNSLNDKIGYANVEYIAKKVDENIKQIILDTESQTWRLIVQVGEHEVPVAFKDLSNGTQKILSSNWWCS